jgi:hypothetical protein
MLTLKLHGNAVKYGCYYDCRCGLPAPGKRTLDMKYTAFKSIVIVALAGTMLLASCSKEKPRTTAEFLDNPRLLEATMVRCAANRTEMKYTEECVNAREAVDRLAVRDEEARRSQLEAESIRKREALRRAQQASEEAQMRAQELERLRREAEYLGQFDEVPPREDGNAPAVDPAAQQPDNAPPPAAGTAPPTDDAPATALPESAATLDDVREELRRRQQSPQN